MVTRPVGNDVVFVPQKPYLVMGTLRDQLIYPHSVEMMRERGIILGEPRNYTSRNLAE